jgi:glycosyltransferase involved in cell wall biosynthesis
VTTASIDSRRVVTRRLRLAHVITGLELGGGGAVVRTIAGALDRDRFDMDVFCIHEGGAYENELRQLQVGVTILDGAWDYRRRLLAYSPSKALQLSAMLRDGCYDIVHTHLFPADVLGRVAARWAGIPVMVRSLHNMGGWRTRRHEVTDRFLARWTDKVICCSDFQREVASAREQLAPEMSVTIHHGVQLSRFSPTVDRSALMTSLGLRADRRTVGTVGRTIPEKGHTFLVDAIPAIVQRHPDAQFLIVGDGAQRTALAARLQASGHLDRVSFAGARADIPEMLALMDVFVFPSVSEGFGIAVIEAMASQLPVVASDIRPLTEIVVDGLTGLLVAPRCGAAIAAGVNDLFDSADRCRALGTAGRRRVEAQFTDSIMVRAHQQLYFDLYTTAAARRARTAA